MKHVKIVGLLVALGGVVASFAAASALYVLGPNEIGFGIGATYTAADGQIDYKIDGKSSGTIAPKYLNKSGSKDDGEGLGGEYTQVLFEFPVSAEFASHGQPYVTGNFSVSLSNINSALFNKASVWVQVKGWTGDYSGKWGESAANSNFMETDASITSATYSVNKNITVSATKEQNVSVYFKLNDDVTLDGATLLALSESKLFDIDVVWGQAVNYDFAYVVGNKTSWEEDEVYAMQPNLKANSFGWYYAGLTGFSTLKVKKLETWAPNDNYEIEHPEYTYNIAWNGGAEGTEGYVFSCSQAS